MFDQVMLKDGREGTVTEIWDAAHFAVDVGLQKWENVDVGIEDIAAVIKKPGQNSDKICET